MKELTMLCLTMWVAYSCVISTLRSYAHPHCGFYLQNLCTTKLLCFTGSLWPFVTHVIGTTFYRNTSNSSTLTRVVDILTENNTKLAEFQPMLAVITTWIVTHPVSWLDNNSQGNPFLLKWLCVRWLQLKRKHKLSTGLTPLFYSASFDANY
jgi:hypothetical protein